MELVIVSDELEQAVVNRVMDGHAAKIDGKCPDWDDREKYPRKVWMFWSDLPGDERMPYVVVDNRDGECFVEQFATLDGAWLYATGVYTTSEYQSDWDYPGAVKDRGGWSEKDKDD